MTEQTQVSASEQKKEDWMNSKWRPMMGWMYMVVCFCDFVLFPVLWSVLHAVMHTTNTTQWQPLTLQGAGLFHIAMGAVLGLAAWGRTQEKLGGANNGGVQLPSGGSSTFGAPSTGGFGSTSSYNTPAPSSFGGNTGFGAAAPASAGFGAPAGRPMPAIGKPANIGPVDDDYMPPRE